MVNIRGSPFLLYVKNNNTYKQKQKMKIEILNGTRIVKDNPFIIRYIGKNEKLKFVQKFFSDTFTQIK